MILITGGNGFVGSVLVAALKRKYPGELILSPSSKELNLLDYPAIEKYLQDNRVDVIFHLAARLGGVGLVSNRPLEFLETNLQINYNIVHAASAAGVKRFITLGSSCSYSADAPLPNRESDLWRGHPENSYGVAKLILLEQLQNQKKMEWVYLVPPNIYGAGDHFGEEGAHFIPATVKKFQCAWEKGEKEIEVWGDGSQTRDFVHVDDIVHFLLRALESTAFLSRPINVGTGVEVSVREIVEVIAQYMGLMESVSIRWSPDKPTGIKRKVLDNALLLELEPGYPFRTINQGLQETLTVALNKGE